MLSVLDLTTTRGSQMDQSAVTTIYRRIQEGCVTVDLHIVSSFLFSGLHANWKVYVGVCRDRVAACAERAQ